MSSVSRHKRLLWTTSLDVSTPVLDDTLGIATTDQLVSHECEESLKLFLEDPFTRAVAIDSSSHPAAGIDALQAQPYLYAGGGLGNIHECETIENAYMCTAGNRGLSFGRLCLPADCGAHDLVSANFVSLLEGHDDYQESALRMLQLNRFLQGSWTCGDWRLPWSTASVMYVSFLFFWTCLVILKSTCWKRRKNETAFYQNRANSDRSIPQECQVPTEESSLLPKTILSKTVTNTVSQEEQESLSDERTQSSVDEESVQDDFQWTDALDMQTHWQQLWRRPASNYHPCLEGLRVGSLLWIVLGHVMAIVSSTVGYNNPAAFLPPNGWTTTFFGQLLFGSRFAVDTFLILSGFLLVHILENKNVQFSQLPMAIVSRVVRILPLYAATLGFFVFAAPHLNDGPFWYQWQAFLAPCVNDWWKNLLFIQNWGDTSVTSTCFYHSWYLAVDMQLFIVCVTSWVLLKPSKLARCVFLSFGLCLSIGASVHGATFRHWSLNTFDGAAVVRYDAEAYAKPLIRAQAYLGGMAVAMMLSDQSHISRWMQYYRFNRLWMCLALVAMAAVSFGTVFGAYSRRPCQAFEWPDIQACGTTWPDVVNLLYTAFSRTVWIGAVSVVLYFCCCGDISPNHRSPIQRFLAWRYFAPFSNLSFGVYLIHPIVIFVWHLGKEDKTAFSLVSFWRDYVWVCAASFIAALFAAMVVELPCAMLWKELVVKKVRSSRSRIETTSSY